MAPCVACKFLRRKCPSDCIFAPYFPPDQTQKFIHIHRVYGTSNFQKLLAELPVDQRQDAVNSLAYEAETRRHDPVYGCIGPIAYLQHRVKNLQGVLQDAYKELATYEDMVLQTQQAMGVAGFPAAQPVPTTMHPLEGNPFSSSSSSEMYKMASMMGIPTGDSSLGIREPAPRTNNNNTSFHPEELFVPTATVGMEQHQEIIRACELQQHVQDIIFDGGRGLDVGTGSSSGVGVEGFSLNNPDPQSNNNNTTFPPEQLVMPIATIGTEQQQDIIRALELQQHRQDIGFDGGRGFDVGTGSSCVVGVIGSSLNNPGPQSNNSTTFRPEQLVMPIATVGTEQQQEIIRALELQQHGQDIRFEGGRGFDIGTGSSGGVGVVRSSLNDLGQQSNNNTTFHPEQLVMPIATIGAERQQEIIRVFELQQLVQDIRFDGGRGFNVGEGRSTGVGVIGSSLNNPGPHSNNNNTFHPEQLFMPTATVGTEQQQEIIRAFELQQHGQDIRFDGGQGLDVGTGSSGGVRVVGSSLNNPGPQSNNNNNTFHPEQLVMPIATVGMEQQQEIIRALEFQLHGQDIRFDGGRGFNVGEGSSTGVRVVGSSLNNPGPHSNNNNTFHPEQLFMPTATVGTEQQLEIIRAFELQQHGQDIRFDGGQGFDIWTGSSGGVRVVGSSLNNPGPQSNNNNTTFHPGQLVMPIATVGMEQQQEIIRALELPLHGQDIRFDGGRGFNVGEGSSTGVGVVGSSLNYPPSLLHVSSPPMMGSFESGFSDLHFQPQLSLQPQQVVTVQEHHTLELESQEEWLQGPNVGNGEAETGSAFYYVNR